MGNSFKKMEDEQLRRNPQAPESVDRGVDSSIGFINMLSNVLELYLPRFFDVLLILTKRKSDLIDSKSSTKEKVITIQITLDKEFDTYTKEDLNSFLTTLSQKSNINKNNFEVISIIEGSVKVTIKMEEGDFQKIFKMFAEGKLEGMNISEIKVEKENSEVSKTLKDRLLEDVRKGKLEDVLTNLHKILASNRESYHLYLQLSGSYHDFKKNSSQFTFDERTTTLNKIRNSIIELINRLEDEDIRNFD